MRANPNDLFRFTTGPRDAEIILVGEAWGEKEAYTKKPFQGHAGKELNRMLFEAGLHRDQILCTNLVDAQPPGNDFTCFLDPGTTKSLKYDRGLLPQPIVTKGRQKLLDLIQLVQPRLIVGAGNWPLWALTDHAGATTKQAFKVPSGILTHRGSQTRTIPIEGISYPYLPIIHPAAILRQWSLRSVTVHDLRARAARYIKGQCEWDDPGFPQVASGDYEETKSYLDRMLAALDAAENPIRLACDVETWKGRWLTVVGLSDGVSAVAVPYFYFDPAGNMINVFTREQEIEINELLRLILLHPRAWVFNQNCAYDQAFLRRYLFLPDIFVFDTMLAQHCMFPGTPKALHNLASLYCEQYTYWKDESQGWDGNSEHEKMWAYNCKDTFKTHEVMRGQDPLLDHFGLRANFDFLMEQWRLSQKLTVRGINWDKQRAYKMREELIDVETQLSNYLLSCVPDDLQYAPSGKPWYNSPSHQKYIFYDRLGIPEIQHKKTKKASLDAESLGELKLRVPWLELLLDTLEDLRSVQVFHRNFLSKNLMFNGRHTTSFNIGGTKTNRWSSSETPLGEGLNLQNFPRKPED